MGGTAHKRLVRKHDLERALAEIEPHPLPNVYLEQYTTPSNVAAEALYLAAYVYDDIFEKTVLELGCGTGRLAIGAALLDAKEVFGVDVDGIAVRAAKKTADIMSVTEKIHWIVADIDVVKGTFDTVLQNPPFGVQKRTADRKFLQKALEVGKTVYSLHNHPRRDKQLIKRLKANPGNLLQIAPSPFIKKFVESRQGTVKAVYAMLMTIPHMFDFHTKKKHSFIVDLYRIKKSD